ncbi:hypothetical protein CSOJ01_03443 [Colletotrichum sojae]|uniref:Uncharacterized protein n=1 Tax=Colletotrichum sojae TaxID=2175907 RepID=A0A8H6JMR3_9PEZI|nr:hypothetical protein CSOJ01_03443 [Colletotrichum sojae]
MTVKKPDHAHWRGAVLYSAQGFQVPTRAADGGVTDNYAFQFGGSRGHRAPLPEAEDRYPVAARNCSAAERASSTRITAEVPAYEVTLIEGTYFGSWPPLLTVNQLGTTEWVKPPVHSTLPKVGCHRDCIDAVRLLSKP